MKASSMVKGALLLAAAGATAYLYTTSSPRTKRNVKRTAENTLHSVGHAFEAVSRSMR